MSIVCSPIFSPQFLSQSILVSRLWSHYRSQDDAKVKIMYYLLVMWFLFLVLDLVMSSVTMSSLGGEMEKNNVLLNNRHDYRLHQLGLLFLDHIIWYWGEIHPLKAASWNSASLKRYRRGKLSLRKQFVGNSGLSAYRCVFCLLLLLNFENAGMKEQFKF